MTDAITREEKLMEAMATGSPSNIKPITREEMFLAKAGGQDVETPEPITRREKLLKGIIDNGGGGGSTGGGGGEYNAKIGIGDAIASNAFMNSTNIVKINDTTIKKIGYGSFKNCTNLQEVIFFSAEKGDTDMFHSCTSLTKAFFPLFNNKIPGSGFYGCTNLTDVFFPLAAYVSSNAFQNCINLKNIDLPLVNKIYLSAFAYCNSLEVVILRSNSIVVLDNISAFNDTPFRGYNGLRGTFYVPQDLIEEYKTATNWSALYTEGFCDFLPIEGSEYE